MTDVVPLTTIPLPVKLRSEDYLMLDDSGAFAGYGKTELIEGEVVYMNAQHRPHARIKSRLHVLLASALTGRADRLEAIVAGSVRISPHSVPEPDIVVTGEADGEGLIPLASVRLVVEVADSTLKSGLTTKATIYAQSGIPEYWIVDVNGRVIHQMWSPASGTYADHRETAFGDPVIATTCAGLTIATTGL
ncbi:hypothetical protein ASE75_06230 [Sphingomonas sp. Leaf17]|uniref:Uma2 family endonuclease n=1 Tax=Sphingomonas sp. Leaf17 TaxID=1735683 RepID=UPI0006FA4F2E|nr:Uma2 family endonuclease [Sphingomonas sp. Leaf17]KQM65823.1 hypothetical protein ASE75_06230 [Sphingomonas sp. Leaf17]